jgi:NADH:ubiquinone oxidoreductase subunit 4 (subunit M)
LKRSIAASSLVVLAFVLPGIASAEPNVTLKLTGAIVSKAADGHTTLTPVE